MSKSMSMKAIQQAVNDGRPIVPPTIATGAVTALAGAPRELVNLYHEEYENQIDAGVSEQAAHRRAIRMTQHAGWHKTSKGWRQLHKDVRDKINVRDAIEQPNGRFVIEDVDVFYPNAVKPGDPYDAERIRPIIANTNRGIESGGQKPSLVEIHPNELQKAIGTQLPTYGSPVNWREHPDPKKAGWVRCDLTDVDPEIVEKLKSRKLTGLSAGIFRDAGGTNLRFGHVAILGGESQALSQLPITELNDVYSVPSQVCFSATPPTDHTLKGSYMNDKLKRHFSAMSDAYSGCAAAFASMTSGEPGADAKVQEAMKKQDDCYAAAESELGTENPFKKMSAPAFAAAPDAIPAVSDFEPDTEVAEPQAAKMNVPPATPMATAPPSATPNFEADPAGAFSAMEGENKILKTQVAKLTALTNGLIGHNLRQEFTAQVDGLKRDGHILPDAAEVEEMFSVCTTSAKPKEGITKLVNMLRKMPKKESPAGAGQIFSAADAQNAPARKDAPVAQTPADRAKQIKRISDAMHQQNFSAADYDLGARIAENLANMPGVSD